ncbi:MAG: inorganic pyrophosphatase [Myxococcota bacterium]|jgi:inorganic pyrophosphatase
MVRDSTPAQVRFVVEVPRGGFIKWGADASIDYISPFPCPFNYGSAPDHPGQDGDPADVVVLGRRRSRGAEGVLRVWGRVRFLDQGHRDDKWICAATPPRRRDRLILHAFFRFYALPKSILGAIKGSGPSRFEGIELSA